MAIIIPGAPSVGAQLGAGLGSGLSTGIQNLIQQKMLEMQQANQLKHAKQTQSNIMNTLGQLGVPKELASYIATLPGKEQVAALGNYFSSQQGAPQSNVGAITNQLNQLGISQQGQPLETQQSQTPLESAFTKTPKLSPDAQARLLQKEAQFNKNLALKSEKTERDKAKLVRDFSKPYREAAEASQNNIRDYDNLIKLARRGKLRAGTTYRLLKSLGLEGLNENIDTQVANKITARLAQNVSSAFKTGRLTNFLEQTFQRSLPSLFNSSQGIITIAEVNKLADQANIIKDTIRKDLIKKYKGDLPYDIEDQINELARPQIDKLEEDAINILQGIQNRSSQENVAVDQLSQQTNSILQEPQNPQEESLGERGLRNVISGSVKGIGQLVNRPELDIVYDDKGNPRFEKTKTPSGTSPLEQTAGLFLPEGYLEPKSENEQLAQDIIGDAVNLLLPSGPVGKLGSLKSIAPKALRAIVGALSKSALSNIAKLGAETVTGSPTVGQGAKIGTLLLSGLRGGRNKVIEKQQQAYTDAYANLPKDKKINIAPYKKEIQDFAGGIIKGDSPSKAFIQERLNAFNNIVKDNKVDPKELVELKKGWNAYIGTGKLPQKTNNELKKLVGIANKAIAKVGKEYPEFYKDYKIGEELTSALKSSNHIQQFLNNHPTLQNTVSNPIVKSLFLGGGLTGAGIAAGLKALPPIAAVGAGFLGVRELGKLLQLLGKSPEARNIYKRVLEAALKNDAKLFAKDIKRLDEIANKEIET